MNQKMLDHILPKYHHKKGFHIISVRNFLIFFCLLAQPGIMHLSELRLDTSAQAFPCVLL